jgi:hypothetical protein
LADFIPTIERPAPLTRWKQATPDHPVHDAWQARLDAAGAARHGPPTRAEAHNRVQLATLERFLFGHVRTPELR